MVAMNLILQSILTGLTTAGFINLTTKKEEDGSTSVLSGDTQIINLPEDVVSELKPYEEVKATLNRISTSATSKPASGNIKLTNVNGTSRILNFSIIPDSNAQTGAVIEVLKGNGTILSVAQGALTDTGVIDLPMPEGGLKFNQGESLETFVYSPTGSTVAVTMMIVTGVY